MSRFGYSKRHLFKDATRRRLFLLRRALARGGTSIDKRATAATVYWVGDADSDWYNSANWASSSPGTGGDGTGGIPKTTTAVVFDGGHTNDCVLGAPAECGALSFTEGVAQKNTMFDQGGHELACTTFTYNCANNTTLVFDGNIVTKGATFTVTAAVSAAPFASATIECLMAVTIASSVALPYVTCGDLTTTAALTLARLAVIPASTLTFFHGVNFTLTAYTVGDWDGVDGSVVEIVSDDASTWGFVNPASMVVSWINVQDSNATNAIDATDNCTDGTGNTNWTFT